METRLQAYSKTIGASRSSDLLELQEMRQKQEIVAECCPLS